MQLLKLRETLINNLMEQLKEYLIEAKRNQWTIDIASLAKEFGLSIDQVRVQVSKYYSN